MKKSTWLLLAAAVAAGTVALILSAGPTSNERRRERGRLLPELARGEVTQFTVQDQDRRTVCRRDSGGWRLEEPFAARTDPLAVRHLLENLLSARRKGLADGPIDGREYGLSEPLRTVRVSATEDRTWTLRVGKPTGVGNLVYVALLEAGHVVMVDAAALPPADVWKRMVSKLLLEPTELRELYRIALRVRQDNGRGGFGWQVAAGRRGWEMQRPWRDAADAEVLRRLFQRLRDYRAEPEDFIAAPNRKTWGLWERPLISLNLHGRHYGALLLFARTEENGESTAYARRVGEDVVVRVPPALLDDVRVPPSAVRRRQLLDVPKSEVSGIGVSGPTGGFELARTEDGWVLDGDRPSPADAGLVEALLTGLIESRAERFFRPADAPPGAPVPDNEQRWTIRLLDGRGERLARVELGAPPGDDPVLYATRRNYPAVLELDRTAWFQPLRRGHVGLLRRVVVQRPVKGAVAVEIHNRAGDFRCARTPDGAWRLTHPVEGKADALNIQDLLGDFANLRAERFVALSAEPPRRYGLENPAVTVSVSYGQEGQTPVRETVHLGAPAPGGGRYGRVAGERRVFVLSDYYARHFERNPASKTICEVERPRRMTFRSEGESATFRYSPEAGTWRSEGHDPPAPVRKAVREAAELLGRFRGMEVVDYIQENELSYGFDRPRLTVELATETARGLRVIIGRRRRGGYYAKGPATQYVLLADEEDVETLLAPLQASED
ncbi:MAG: DUF4340 domain-containing protein [Planctomycetota bacterium]